MANKLIELGFSHKPNEYVANWELGLDELNFLASIIPSNDTFLSDVCDAIDKIETANANRREQAEIFSKHFDEHASPLLKAIVRSMYL